MKLPSRAALVLGLVLSLATPALAACDSAQDSGASNVQGGTNRAPGAPPQGTARPTATTGR